MESERDHTRQELNQLKVEYHDLKARLQQQRKLTRKEKEGEDGWEERAMELQDELDEVIGVDLAAGDERRGFCTVWKGRTMEFPASVMYFRLAPTEFPILNRWHDPLLMAVVMWVWLKYMYL